MGILTVDLNNIHIVDTNYGEDDLKTIIHIRLGIINLKNAKQLKEN